jgi:hypothetical protein
VPNQVGQKVITGYAESFQRTRCGYDPAKGKLGLVHFFTTFANIAWNFTAASSAEASPACFARSTQVMRGPWSVDGQELIRRGLAGQLKTAQNAGW